MTIPSSKYHPDPLATSSVVASDAVCECCGKSRGYIYVGPVYAEEELDEALCPWCIDDGSAHERFGATFTDDEGIGGYGDWDSVPKQVVEQVAWRTPGFSAWQQAQWWTHCGDAAAFLGRAGSAELEAYGESAMAAIRESAGLPEGGDWDELLAALDKDGSPTAYVFRCTKCGAFGGYHDFD